MIQSQLLFCKSIIIIVFGTPNIQQRELSRYDLTFLTQP